MQPDPAEIRRKHTNQALEMPSMWLIPKASMHDNSLDKRISDCNSLSVEGKGNGICVEDWFPVAIGLLV